MNIKKTLLLGAISLITLFPPSAQAIPVNLEILPIPASITVTPSTDSIEVNETIQYTAIAIFADASTLDITTDPLTTWNSETSTIASIDNSDTNRGLATGLANGTSIITATYGNVTSNNANLTVGNNGGGGGGGGGEDDDDDDDNPPTNQLEIEIHPEKRHDLTGEEISTFENNQDIQAQIKLFNSTTGQNVYTVETKTNDKGIVTLPIENIPEGIYDISVKTISHLRNTTKSVPLTWPTSKIDLSKNKSIILKAGDVNQTYGDNFVNGMDYSVIANKIYSTDKKTDLNRDNIVNGIDFAITTTNIYKTGDN